MPKKLRVTKLIDNQHAKMSERLLISARQYFYHIFRSLWNEISSNNSVLVVYEILTLFVNILSPDNKHYLSVKASV